MSNDTILGAPENGATLGAAKRLNKSLQNSLYAKNALGSSKHEAKQHSRKEYFSEHGTLKGWNPSKLDGIYSRRTMETYLNVMPKFAQYCANRSAKRLSDLNEAMGEDYLRYLSEQGKSNWSISTASSALNKALDWELSPTKLGLSKRSKKDITRSRIARAHDSRDFSAYEDQIFFAKATGVRRMSVTVVRPCDCVRNETGTVVGVHVIEKGGKHRVAPVLNTHRDTITAMVNTAIAKNGETAPIFDSYDIHIDNHRFRAEFAAALLHQLEDERVAGQSLFGGAFALKDYCRLKGKDAKRKNTTAGHDTDLLGAVSGALGHNRIEVVLGHYLYLY